jgi:hypothetical protein
MQVTPKAFLPENQGEKENVVQQGTTFLANTSAA